MKAVQKKKARSADDRYDVLYKELRASLDEGAIRMASEGFDSDVKLWIPTGYTQLDVLLRGGVPVGRIIEIFGREGTGKTTLATQILANCQRMDGLAVLLDSESKFYPDRAKTMGVDLGRLYTVQAKTVEKGFEYITRMLPLSRQHLAPTEPAIIVWDTLAAAATDLEYEEIIEDGEETKSTYHKAKVIKKHLRVLAPLLAQTQVGLVILNQVMETQYGDKPPGGTGVRHHTSARINMRRVTEEDGDATVEARMWKCQLDGAYTVTDRAKLVIRPHGVADHVSMLEFLCEQKACKEVSKAGGWFTIVMPSGDEVKAQRSSIEQRAMEVEGLSDFLKDRTLFYMIGATQYARRMGTSS